MIQKNIYSLDNSAMIHLAAKRKNHTNTFRIEMQLNEFVSGEILQIALEHILKRFPTIMAEIHRGILKYYLCPVRKIPRVMEETAKQSSMSKEEIKNGAFRVLYHQNYIAVEFFHALTDGHGGLVVTSTLVAEYLKLKYKIKISNSELVLNKDDTVKREEIVDDYITFAGENAKVPEHSVSFQLSDYVRQKEYIKSDIQYYEVKKVLYIARYYHISVTTFITSIMMQAILEIQKKHKDEKKRKQLVKILVPVDLRRMYGSKTLRNFSLFAVCSIIPQEKVIPLSQIMMEVKRQLDVQITKKYMSKELASQIKAVHFPLYKALPLPIKNGLLRLAQELWGESNSCITISNLGVISFPENMEKYVQNVSMELTPRRKTPYNCGIVSYKGNMIVRFSRYCKETELEDIFYKKMQNNISETFHRQFSNITKI